MTNRDLRSISKRWPWLLLALALLGLGWLLSHAVLAGRDATWMRIQESGVWRVGMDPSFPPFEELDPETGRPVGFDVELAEALAARWGVRVEFVGVGFDQLVDAVAAHRVDSAISALPVFEHRAKEVAFSTPYIEAGVVLAVPPGSPIQDAEGLAGARVAVEWGSEGDAQARVVQKRLGGNVQLVPCESAGAALAAVVAGNADAAIVDAVSLALFNRAGGDLRPVGEPLRAEPYVIVVPRDAPRLLAEVNEALEALSADGTLTEIKGRWLGMTSETPLRSAAWLTTSLERHSALLRGLLRTLDATSLCCVAYYEPLTPLRSAAWLTTSLCPRKQCFTSMSSPFSPVCLPGCLARVSSSGHRRPA